MNFIEKTGGHFEPLHTWKIAYTYYKKYSSLKSQTGLNLWNYSFQNLADFINTL